MSILKTINIVSIDNIFCDNPALPPSPVAVCPPPAATLGNVSGVVERVTGSGSLFLVNQKVNLGHTGDKPCV